MSSTPAVTEPDREWAIDASGLAKSFKVGGRSLTALHNLDVRINKGGTTGLVGSDGAGKTTFLRLVAGLFLPESGTLHVLDVNAAREPERLRGRVGYMPQRFGLYEDLSVAENLGLYADLYGLPARRRKARFAELLDFTGLGPFQARLAGRLSGGMKQKLGLACTLVHPT